MIASNITYKDENKPIYYQKSNNAPFSPMQHFIIFKLQTETDASPVDIPEQVFKHLSLFLKTKKDAS